MRAWAWIMACLIALPASASLVRVDGPFFVGQGQLPDSNQNTLNTEWDLPNLRWTEPLQALQNAIDSQLVLPQSLLRTFLLVIEKSVGSSSVPVRPVPTTTAQQAFLDEFLRHGPLDHHRRSTLQVLTGLGCDATTGLLVERYAQIAKRGLLRVHGFASPIGARNFARTLLERTSKGEDPVVLYEENTLSTEAREIFSFTAQHRAFLGNASMVIISKAPTPELDPWVDSRHVVPLTSPEYYAEMLWRKIGIKPPGTREIASRLTAFADAAHALGSVLSRPMGQDLEATEDVPTIGCDIFGSNNLYYQHMERFLQTRKAFWREVSPRR